jgi:hypothetical protein
VVAVHVVVHVGCRGRQADSDGRGQRAPRSGQRRRRLPGPVRRGAAAAGRIRGGDRRGPGRAPLPGPGGGRARAGAGGRGRDAGRDRHRYRAALRPALGPPGRRGVQRPDGEPGDRQPAALPGARALPPDRPDLRQPGHDPLRRAAVRRPRHRRPGFIGCAGAYTTVYASGFNGFDVPEIRVG